MHRHHPPSRARPSWHRHTSYLQLARFPARQPRVWCRPLRVKDTGGRTRSGARPVPIVCDGDRQLERPVRHTRWSATPAPPTPRARFPNSWGYIGPGGVLTRCTCVEPRATSLAPSPVRNAPELRRSATPWQLAPAWRTICIVSGERKPRLSATRPQRDAVSAVVVGISRRGSGGALAGAKLLKSHGWHAFGARVGATVRNHLLHGIVQQVR